MQAQGAQQCFNRTFMELKSPSFLALKTENLRFNRTFMELKLQMRTYLSTGRSVLIVPLWN